MGLDKFLKETLDTNVTKVNTNVMTGGWGEIINRGHIYLDKIIKNAFSNLKLKDRIVYKGYRPATLEEELNILNNSASKKRKQDIGKSNMSLFVYMFEIDGEPINKELYIPYCKYNSSMIEISGNCFHLIPVMTYNIISPKSSEVFVKLNKQKLIYKTTNYNYLFNGIKNIIDLVYVDTKKNDLAKPTKLMKVNQIATLQIICGYGIRRAFKKYLDMNYGDDFYIVSKEKINNKEYVIDFNKYNILENIPDKSIKSDLGCVVIVKKSINLTNIHLNYLVGILYTLEHFPSRIKGLLELIEEDDVNREVNIWRALFIIFSFSGDNDYQRSRAPAIKLFEEDIPTFITDEEAKELTKISNNYIKGFMLEIKNFYDLCHYMICSYTIYVNTFREYNNNIDNKKLDILYYIYYPQIQLFNKIVVNCNKPEFMNSSNLANQFKKEITQRNRLTMTSIYNAFSSTKLPLAVLPIDNTLDNKYLKITASIEDQNNGDGIHKKKKPSKITFDEFAINPMDMITGSILYLNKKKNSAKYKANIFLSLDGLIIDISDEERTKINKIKNMLVLTTKQNNEDLDIDELETDKDDTREVETDIDTYDTDETIEEVED